jgi:hypothetical protein
MMKLEDIPARMALFELEDKVTRSNLAIAQALDKLRLAVVGGAWLIVIALALCTWLG